ncbi:hypothetical protein LTR36_001434 [Oleoguttula mirabilis]|uniref:Uncharacterized protein n=1 Tax=Oleoguttula mirabilis TaxID=1507867 RepID=A0AAV9JP78_9PEZI|nr:hypothetical protein LTR36_001434 [Oleoguttula mirabilis]
MAPSRAVRPLSSICASCARQQILVRRQFATSRSLRMEEIRNESRLPRIANPSLWSSLVPRFLRRRSPEEVAERAAVKATGPKQWNPYTSFIILAVLVGSNAINIIALRNEMLNFSRKTDAKLELLREVVQRVKNGEDVDVKRLLGTGDQQSEQEWEEVMKELESTDMLWEGKVKREAKQAAKAEQKRLKDEKAARDREASPVASEATPAEAASERRPKFLM